MKRIYLFTGRSRLNRVLTLTFTLVVLGLFAGIAFSAMGQTAGGTPAQPAVETTALPPSWAGMLAPILQAIGGNQGWLVGLVTWIGLLRLIIKPITNLVEKAAHARGASAELAVARFEGGPVAQTVKFFLDYFGSIKVSALPGAGKIAPLVIGTAILLGASGCASLAKLNPLHQTVIQVAPGTTNFVPVYLTNTVFQTAFVTNTITETLPSGRVIQAPVVITNTIERTVIITNAAAVVTPPITWTSNSIPAGTAATVDALGGMIPVPGAGMAVTALLAIAGGVVAWKNGQAKEAALAQLDAVNGAHDATQQAHANTQAALSTALGVINQILPLAGAKTQSIATSIETAVSQANAPAQQS